MQPFQPISDGFVLFLQELMRERGLMLTDLAKDLHRRPRWVAYALAQELWVTEVTKQDIQKLAELAYPNLSPPKAVRATAERCRINYDTLLDS